MFGFGKCKHEFADLRVYKAPTTEPSTKYPGEYNHVTLHLCCGKCGAGNLEKGDSLAIKFAETIGGHEAAMERAMDREQRKQGLHSLRNDAADRILARDPNNAEAKAFKEDDNWMLVPTKFNGIDGNHVYAGRNGEIEFRNAKGKVDRRTIESVAWRMEKGDVQASPELRQTCQDAIDFALKRKNGEI